MPAQVKASGATAIVRVDEVIIASPALASYAGQNVTVLLQDQERVTAGEQATFYTDPSVFGESVAVQSQGHEDVGSARAMLAAPSGDPVKNAASRDLRVHAAAAETVVTGTVLSTHLVSAPPAAMQLLAAEPVPISEHDPEWHDAVVAVSNVEKGAQGQQQVVVRYPNSMDVRWYMVPKLRPGMTGSFVLHPAESPEVAHTMTAGLLASVDAGAPQPQFVLLHPEDFQPHDQVEHDVPRAPNPQP
jgi:hypothetical protein